jgi:two-component system sensor histidine kinase PrrB
LTTRLNALAPVIANAPTSAQLVSTLSASSSTDGVRVIKDGQESRAGSMPLRPPVLTDNKITTVKNGDERWYALSVSVPVAPSIAASPVQVEMFQPLTDLDNRLAVIRRRMRFILAACVAASVALGGLAGNVVSRPLRRLSHAVVDPGQKVPENQGVSEVDELGRTINRAMSQLHVALESARGFAFNAVHELRTPLTSIRTDLDVLRLHPDLSSSDRAELVESITRQHERLTSTLGALHDLSRGEFQTEAEVASVDLAEIVEEAVDSARASHAGVHFDLFSPEHAPIQGWAEGLRLAFDNLLTNAARHGAKHVTVRLENKTASVSDDGPGIPDELKSTVFDRFARGSTDVPGTGLGLALVKQQAELHGGSIRVVDVEPHGANFIWTF